MKTKNKDFLCKYPAAKNGRVARVFRLSLLAGRPACTGF